MIKTGDDEHYLGASFNDSVPWDTSSIIGKSAIIPTTEALEKMKKNSLLYHMSLGEMMCCKEKGSCHWDVFLRLHVNHVQPWC